MNNNDNVFPNVDVNNNPDMQQNTGAEQHMSLDQLMSSNPNEPVVIEQSAFEPLSMEQPAFQMPVVEPVVLEQPVYQQPVVEPVMQQPVYQQSIVEPIMQQPVYQQPIVESVVMQQPVYQQPIVTPVQNTQPSNDSYVPNKDYQNNYYVEPKTNKPKFLISLKLVFAVLAFIVVAIAAYFGYKTFMGSSSTAVMNAIFDPNNLIMINEDGLYGFISSEGKEVIKPQFTSASPFVGKYTKVQIPSTAKNYVSDKQAAIIDEKGNIMLTASSTYVVDYYELDDVWVVDSVLYSGSLKKLTTDTMNVDYVGNGYLTYTDSSNNTGGIINKEGKKIYKYTFDDGNGYISLEFSSLTSELTKSYCVITVNDGVYKEAIADCASGKIIYDFTEKAIMSGSDNVFEIYDRKTYDTEKMIYVEDGKVAYSVLGEIRLEYYKKDYLEIYDDTKSYAEEFSYYDLKNKKVVKTIPDGTVDEILLTASEILTGYKEYSCNYKYGIMKSDKVVLTCEWDDITFVDSMLYKYLEAKKGIQLVFAEKDDVTVLYNLKNGKKLISFDSISVSDYVGSTFIKSVKDNTATVYNTLSGKSMTFEKNQEVYIYSNYVTTEKDNVVTYYNTNLKMIYTEK